MKPEWAAEEVPLPAWAESAVPVKKSGPGVVESALRGAAQGASFGFADEAEGIVQGLYDTILGDHAFGPAYKSARDKARAQYAAAREANPVAFGVGEIGGGVASGLLGLGAAGGAAKGAGLLARGVSLAGAGAIEGGAAGLGYSEADNVGDMARDVAMGAGMGAAAGVALPAAGHALKQAAKKVMPAIGKLSEHATAAVLGPSVDAQRLAKIPGQLDRVERMAADIPKAQIEVEQAIAGKVKDAESRLAAAERGLGEDIAAAIEGKKAEISSDRRKISDRMLEAIDRFNKKISKESGEAFGVLGQEFEGVPVEVPREKVEEIFRREIDSFRAGGAYRDSDEGMIKRLSRMVERVGTEGGPAPADTIARAMAREEKTGFNPALYDTMSKIETARKKAAEIGKKAGLLEEIKYRQIEHDNNPVRGLRQYANPRTGELPEVLGKGKNEFARKGDQIAKDLDFEDSETARLAYEAWIEDGRKLNELKKLAKSTRGQAREVKAMIREVENDVRSFEQKDPLETVIVPVAESERRNSVKLKNLKTLIQAIDSEAEDAAKMGLDARQAELLGRIRKSIDNEILKNPEVNPRAAEYASIMDRLAADTTLARDFEKQIRTPDSQKMALERVAAQGGGYRDESLARLMAEADPDVVPAAQGVAAREAEIDALKPAIRDLQSPVGARDPELRAAVAGKLGSDVVSQAERVGAESERLRDLRRYAGLVQQPRGGLNPERVARAGELLGADLAADAQALQAARQFMRADVQGSRRTTPFTAIGGTLGAMAGGAPGAAVGSAMGGAAGFAVDKYGGRLALKGIKAGARVKRALDDVASQFDGILSERPMVSPELADRLAGIAIQFADPPGVAAVRSVAGNPGSLGKYAQRMRQAMMGGFKRFMIAHGVLYRRDQDYRSMIDAELTRQESGAPAPRSGMSPGVL